MRTETFHQAVILATDPAFGPASVPADGNPQNGRAISVKQEARGRDLVFMLSHGDPGDTLDSELTIGVEGSEDEGTPSTWETVKDKDGNDLEFDVVAITGTAGGTAAATLMGTVRTKQRPYFHYRLVITGTAAKTAVDVAATALVWMTDKRPTGQVDGLLEKMLPDGTLAP